jgi:hypothetical protein
MFLKFHGYAMPRYVKTYYLGKRMMRKGKNRNTMSPLTFSSNPSKGSVMWFRHAVWNMILQFYLKGRRQKLERRVLT